MTLSKFKGPKTYFDPNVKGLKTHFSKVKGLKDYFKIKGLKTHFLNLRTKNDFLQS